MPIYDLVMRHPSKIFSSPNRDKSNLIAVSSWNLFNNTVSFEPIAVVNYNGNCDEGRALLEEVYRLIEFGVGDSSSHQVVLIRQLKKFGTVTKHKRPIDS